MAILLIKLKHIGDVLLTTAAIRHLKECLPNEPLSMLVRGGADVALANNSDLAEVFSFGSLGSSETSLGARLKENILLFRWLRRGRFRAALNFFPSDRGAISAWVSGASARMAYRAEQGRFQDRLYTKVLPYDPTPLHQALKDLRLAEAFTGRRAVEPRLHFNTPEQLVQQAENRWNLATGQRKECLRLICHPTSRWMFKCWDKGRWGSLLREIAATTNVSILISHGPAAAECQMAEEILALSHPCQAQLAGNLTFPELGALIQQADIFIGIDSAPMHLAAAVNQRVIGIFGPSSNIQWRPFCEHSEPVFQPCSCQSNMNLICPKSETMKCLQAVTVDQVMASVHRLMLQQHSRPAVSG